MSNKTGPLLTLSSVQNVSIGAIVAESRKRARRTIRRIAAPWLASFLAALIGLGPVPNAFADGVLELPSTSKSRSSGKSSSPRSHRARAAASTDETSPPDSDSYDADEPRSTSPPPNLGSANDYIADRDDNTPPAPPPRRRFRPRVASSPAYSPYSSPYDSYDEEVDDPGPPPGRYGGYYPPEASYGRPSGGGVNWTGLIVGGLILGLSIAEMNASRHRRR